LLGGAEMYYRSKLHAVVATSSTEAEFVAAVSASKVALMLRTILRELGVPQSGPTILFVDNTANIYIGNQDRPTERCRHIDIQYFALQSWIQRGGIKLSYYAGLNNMSDSLTKVLDWVLHHRHVTRFMGYTSSLRKF